MDWTARVVDAEPDRPDILCGVLAAVLASPLPTIALWGPEGIVLGNDAFLRLGGHDYAPLLGKPLPADGAVIGGLDPALLRQVAGGARVHLHGRSLRSPEKDPDPRGPNFDFHAAPIAAGDTGAASGLLGTFVEMPLRHNHADRREVEWHQALLLAITDQYRAASNVDEIVAIAASTIGRELGASRVSYGDVELVHGAATFSAGWSDGSLPPRSGSTFFDELIGTRTAELQAGRSLLVRGGEDGIATRFVAPLTQEGRPRALFVVETRNPAGLSPSALALIENVATRCWDAIERARASAILRRNQTRQGFLLVLGDRLRELESAGDMMETVAESLGHHLRLSRVGYGEIVGRGEILFSTGWSDGGLPPLIGHFPLSELGEEHLADLSRGLTTIFDPHAAGSGGAPPAVMAGLRALAAVPLIRDGRLRGALVMGHAERHQWPAEEIAIAGEVAARLWEALERARAEAALQDLNVTLENRVAQRTEELQASEVRFRTLFENAPAPIGLIRIEPDGEVLFEAMNAAAAAFLGRPMSSLRGEPVTGGTSSGESVAALCRRCAETGAPVQYEMIVKDGSGSRTAEWVLAPLPIRDIDSRLLIGIGRDITAQRNAEEQLRQAQKMEAIGQLTGGIAHDFNNLLTGIIGSLALMEKRLAQGRTETVPRYVGLAMASANRAAALTHRLLAFSRRQPLEAKAVDVNTLVASMDDLLRRTLGESVALETRVSPDVWPTLCDPHQLENALLNLAINGRDAMPDGGRLTIGTGNAEIGEEEAEREPGLNPGRYVVVSVTDTGTGMTPDVIARAFDPFFTTKPIGQGTGLGLSMIYGFAKQSDGHIRIESEPGHGTTVRIYLPRFRGRIAPEASPAAGTAPKHGAGETVLVVEDDTTVRGLVLEVLSELRYRAVEAADGPEGLRLLQSDLRVDLLVTDVGLPGMNGRQLAEQARIVRPDLKVLFITGYAENAAFGAGHLDAGMQMMTKPFAVEELATRIRSIFEA